MFDDESARRAFRTLTDEPAPPPTTTVDQVMRRGRRRVFTQRAGAAAGVMAVVAAIGVGTTLLRGGGEDLQVGDGPPTSTSEGPSGALDPLPPDWEQVPMPDRIVRSGANCQDPHGPELPPEPPLGPLPEQQVTEAYEAAVGQVAGDEPTVTTSEWTNNSPKTSAPRGYVAIEIPVGGGASGNAQLQLEVSRYGGRPDQIADATLTAYGNCVAPARHIAPDGTILQLYPVETLSLRQPIQHLRIYRPDNSAYTVTAAPFSEADIEYRKDGTASVNGGRGKLPVTQNELMGIGLALVIGLG